MPLILFVAPLLTAAVPTSIDGPSQETVQSDCVPAGEASVCAGDTRAQEDAAAPETAPELPDSDSAPKEDGILVTGRLPSPVDPVEQLNVVSYQAVQAVDAAVIAPVTHAYAAGVPKPVRDGLHNVLGNLDEPIVFINFILQLKPGKAIETLARFAINSTLGVGGLIDVAKRKPFNLPRRSNGLADTLGYYGVGPGPYLFLPLIGATTLRDLVARPFDLAVLPVIAPKPFGDPKVALGKGVLSAIDEREENDEKLKRLRATKDPYLSQREEYLARRRAEIEVLKGKRKSIDDPPYYVIPEPASGNETANPPAAPAPVETEPTQPDIETEQAMP